MALDIASSVFRHSHFCKGMIVFREQPIVNSTMLYNVTHQARNIFVNRDLASKIYVLSSTFEDLNMGSVTTHVSAIEDHNDFTMELYVHSITFNNIKFPLFQHKGIVLNVQDFKGEIAFKFSDILENLIFIPYTYNVPN